MQFILGAVISAVVVGIFVFVYLPLKYGSREVKQVVRKPLLKED